MDRSSWEERPIGYRWETQAQALNLAETGGYPLGHVLDYDPDLGTHIPDAERARARVSAVAPMITIAGGCWTFEGDPHLLRRHQGLLLLSGHLARSVTVEGLTWTELIGAGDVVRPWTFDSYQPSLVRLGESWEALTWIRLAVLDGAFARRVAEWPEISATLLDRAVHRAHVLSAHMTMCRIIPTDARLLHYLWNAADRWGTVRRDGVVVALPRNTHAFLSSLVGAHRQSVTAALAKLRDARLVERIEEGWLLRGKRPPRLHPGAANPDESASR